MFTNNRHLTNDNRTFDKNNVDQATYTVRSTIIVLDQNWFTTTVIDDATDNEVLADSNVQFTQMKTLINEIATCLNQIKSTFKPVTSYILLTGHPLFKAAVVFVCKCLNVVTIELDPVNTRPLKDYDDDKK